MAKSEDFAQPSLNGPDNYVDAWRLRCPNCGAAQWAQVAQESERLVFECLSCHESSQVDLVRSHATTQA